MRYLKMVVLFFTIFIIFDRGMYYILSRFEPMLYPEKDYMGAMADYHKGKKYDTLILGSSRTSEAIHSVHIENFFGKKAFKEADHAKAPKYSYYFYKEYKKIAGTPDLVIYGVDYFMYNMRTDRNLLARLPGALNDNYTRNLLSSVSLIYDNRGDIANIFNNTIEWIKKLFFNKSDFSSYKIISKLQKFVGHTLDNSSLVDKKPQGFFTVPFNGPPGAEGEYFPKLLDELEADGVRVMLVILPDYYGSYVTCGQKRDLVKHLWGFERKYKNVSVHNYNMPEIFPLKNKDFFRDGGFGNPNSHLSAAGGEYLFKNLLKKDLEKIYGMKARKGVLLN